MGRTLSKSLLLAVALGLAPAAVASSVNEPRSASPTLVTVSAYRLVESGERVLESTATYPVAPAVVDPRTAPDRVHIDNVENHGRGRFEWMPGVVTQGEASAPVLRFERESAYIKACAFDSHGTKVLTPGTLEEGLAGHASRTLEGKVRLQMAFAVPQGGIKTVSGRQGCDYQAPSVARVDLDETLGDVPLEFTRQVGPDEYVFRVQTQ